MPEREKLTVILHQTYYLGESSSIIINTTLGIFAGPATATMIVIPNVPEVQAKGNPGYGKCYNPGILRDHGHPC